MNRHTSQKIKGKAHINPAIKDIFMCMKNNSPKSLFTKSKGLGAMQSLSPKFNLWDNLHKNW